MHHRSHDQGGLCPGSLSPRGISIQGESLSRKFLFEGFSVQGFLCPGVLVQWLFVQGRGICLVSVCPGQSLSRRGISVQMGSLFMGLALCSGEFPGGLNQRIPVQGFSVQGVSVREIPLDRDPHVRYRAVGILPTRMHSCLH